MPGGLGVRIQQLSGHMHHSPFDIQHSPFGILTIAQTPAECRR